MLIALVFFFSHASARPPRQIVIQPRPALDHPTGGRYSGACSRLPLARIQPCSPSIACHVDRPGVIVFACCRPAAGAHAHAVAAARSTWPSAVAGSGVVKRQASCRETAADRGYDRFVAPRRSARHVREVEVAGEGLACVGQLPAAGHRRRRADRLPDHQGDLSQHERAVVGTGEGCATAALAGRPPLATPAPSSIRFAKRGLPATRRWRTRACYVGAAERSTAPVYYHCRRFRRQLKD